MKYIFNRWAYPIMTLITLISFALIIVLLANGNRANREEIIKSRQINIVGRDLVIQTIERVCGR